MMRAGNVMYRLRRDAIILDMKANTKEAALRELAGIAATLAGRFTEETFYNILLDRENIGSTGVGNGVAIPHGKIDSLDETLVCFGRSRDGVNFDAIDNRPVHLFVVIFSPTHEGEEYLQTLASVRRMLKQPGRRQKLFNSSNHDAIIDVFTTWK